jgi:hypothetical protein
MNVCLYKSWECWTRWCTLVIPALGRWRQKDLVSIKNRKQKSWDASACQQTQRPYKSIKRCNFSTTCFTFMIKAGKTIRKKKCRNKTGLFPFKKAVIKKRKFKKMITDKNSLTVDEGIRNHYTLWWEYKLTETLRKVP